MKIPLSERIRPNSEAAPWVIEEVKELEQKYELAVLQANVYVQQLEWLEGQNQKMLGVLEELDECATYWSEYEVPIGIHDRIKLAIANPYGKK
jgi:uncharacterized phage-like protein YoqJ